MSNQIVASIFAIIGGIAPALIWLYYWTREDEEHPEPRRRIMITFSFGMAAVIVTLFSQHFISRYFLGGLDTTTIFKSSALIGVITAIIFSFIEEVLKYIAAYYGGIHTRDADEAIDVLIYMIVAALGFAALENVLYIFQPLLANEAATAIIAGNIRFIGATLLHVGTSIIIGLFIAFSIFKNNSVQKKHVWIGLITATLLHAAFNLLIIMYERYTVVIFAAVWIGLLISLLAFEKIKKIHLNRIQ